MGMGAMSQYGFAIWHRDLILVRIGVMEWSFQSYKQIPLGMLGRYIEN
jgi:hypothetical protein